MYAERVREREGGIDRERGERKQKKSGRNVQSERNGFFPMLSVKNV